MKIELKDKISSGSPARLIPVVADSKKEERATSCVLASFMIVPALAKEVLSEAGAPVNSRSKITCYTEVTFKDEAYGKIRPDGLILVNNGKKTWSALVESKVGNADLKVDQVEAYLDLAKSLGIDALITISNQFAITPEHHPLKVSKVKTKSVDLYHFSWLSLTSKAVLLTDNKVVDDPEQAFILSELVRYLQHDFSGVSALTQMHGDWKKVCNDVQHGAALKKSDNSLMNTVSSWQQLQRQLALELSMGVGQSVKIAISRARLNDAALNFQEECDFLVKNNAFLTEFSVPDAAENIALFVDFMRRTISISMKLQAPKDKSRASASINWITKQLKNTDSSNLGIRAYWPGRLPMTTVSLEKAIEDPNSLIHEGRKELPTHLEIVRVVDLAGKFKGSKTFVEVASREFPGFYKDVGQHLVKWVPSAPKVKEKKEEPSPQVPAMYFGAGFGLYEANSPSGTFTPSKPEESER